MSLTDLGRLPLHGPQGVCVCVGVREGGRENFEMSGAQSVHVLHASNGPVKD